MYLIRSTGFVSILAAAAMFPAAFAATPAIGDKAPDFSLSTVQGKTLRLSDVSAKNRVVLIVLRGFPGYQCPFCNRQVQDFITKSKDFAAAGARVVMVYPGPPQDLATRATEFVAGKTLPANFDLLLDPGYEFTNLYGLRWNAPGETAYPSTFIIEKSGSVVFSKTSKEHGGRSTAAEILDVLAKQKSGQ